MAMLKSPIPVAVLRDAGQRAAGGRENLKRMTEQSEIGPIVLEAIKVSPNERAEIAKEFARILEVRMALKEIKFADKVGGFLASLESADEFAMGAEAVLWALKRGGALPAMKACETFQRWRGDWDIFQMVTMGVTTAAAGRPAIFEKMMDTLHENRDDNMATVAISAIMASSKTSQKDDLNILNDLRRYAGVSQE